MNIFKRIKDEFIFGGHIMSLGAACIVGSYSLMLDRAPDSLYLLITYFGVHSIYLFDRYKEIKSDICTNPGRADYLLKHKILTQVMIIGYFLGSLGILAYQGKIAVIGLWLTMYALGFAYGVYFKQLSRKITGFKDFFVPAVYLLLLFAYNVHAHVRVDYAAVSLIIFIYIRLFVATVFYDLKDVVDDGRKKLKTFAVILPRQKFYTFINAINLLSALPIIFGVYENQLPYYSLMILLIVPYFSYYVEKSKGERDLTIFSYVYCDGEYLLWFPILVFSHYLFV
ncbi:MAG: UbiA family prenyltransferase [Patescibacteria group bacterium]|jgi:4-hydroxybenzoate polyprenyltransferase